MTLDGKALASHRRIVSKQCVVCGAKFQGFANQKYCRTNGDACRMKAAYEQNRGK